MLKQQQPGASVSYFSCSRLCSRIHCAHSSSLTRGAACCGELQYKIVRNMQFRLREKLSTVSCYRRGSHELQERHIMCVSELMRLSAAVCARVTERNSGLCMMEHLAGLLGQLLAAGCSAGSRNTLIPVLLKQARKLRPPVVHKAVDIHSAAHASCSSVQMLPDEHFRWPLRAQTSLLAAVRLSGWDAVSMAEKAVMLCESKQRHLEIAFADTDILGFSKEDLRDYVSQLNSCRQWVLLLHAKLPQARNLALTSQRACSSLVTRTEPLAVLLQVLLQKLRRTAVNIIQLTASDLHIVPSVSGVTIAAVHLLLALPCDGGALRSVLPGLSEGQRHPQVWTSSFAAHSPALRALITGHQGSCHCPAVQSHDLHGDADGPDFGAMDGYVVLFGRWRPQLRRLWPNAASCDRHLLRSSVVRCCISTGRSGTRPWRAWLLTRVPLWTTATCGVSFL